MGLKSLWQQIFVVTFRKLEQDKIVSKEHSLNTQTTGVLIVAALCLVFAEYAGNLKYLIISLDEAGAKYFAQSIKQWLERQADPKWLRLMFWAGITISAFLLIPLAYIRWGLKQHQHNFGWQLRATRQDLLLYAACFIFMLPLVILMSSSPMFLAKYPFYQPKPQNSGWIGYFILWELIYLVQFIAVEFFFRGFILHGIKKQLGAYSIWVAMIPYCMIHFAKPLPETLGAIVAGLVLGTFSLKNNSIWLGVLLHYGVAITMDLLALWHKGLLF